MNQFASRVPFVLRACADCERPFLPKTRKAGRCADCQRWTARAYALFSAEIIEDGVRRDVRRDELCEYLRLWTAHADIRCGTVAA